MTKPAVRQSESMAHGGPSFGGLPPPCSGQEARQPCSPDSFSSTRVDSASVLKAIWLFIPARMQLRCERGVYHCVIVRARAAVIWIINGCRSRAGYRATVACRQGQGRLHDCGEIECRPGTRSTACSHPYRRSLETQRCSSCSSGAGAVAGQLADGPRRTRYRAVCWRHAATKRRTHPSCRVNPNFRLFKALLPIL